MVFPTAASIGYVTRHALVFQADASLSSSKKLARLSTSAAEARHPEQRTTTSLEIDSIQDTPQMNGRQLVSVSVIFREAVWCLEHDDARKLRQRRLCVLPDPDRDIFRCRIFESLDIVQIIMVEPVQQGFEGGLDREEIRDKTGARIDSSFKPQFHAIGMSMQPAAAMLLGNIRQKVSRLETEGLRNLHKQTFMACR